MVMGGRSPLRDGEGAADRGWLVGVWQVCIHRVAGCGVVRVVYPSEWLDRYRGGAIFCGGTWARGRAPCFFVLE